jgi:DNA-binding response OmpR family regulator
VIASDLPRANHLNGILQSAGHTVEVATDALAAANALPATVQVVVIAGSKPYWPAEHICRICSAIRRAAPKLPVIVVGPDDVEAKVRLFKLGADDYVVEPLDSPEFLARIRALLRRLMFPRGI